MDTGKGKFEHIEADNEEELARLMRQKELQHPDHGGWFRVGEIIELRGSRFRVKAVKPTELRLKLLPKSKQ